MSIEPLIATRETQETSASGCYWQHYHWHQDPFSNIRDDIMTLLLPCWEAHLDVIQHLLHKQNIIVALIGEQGAGKTTFLQLLMSQVGSSMHVHPINGDELITPQKLVEILARIFHLQLDPSELLEEQLDSLVTELQYKDLPCLLAIDDAERLPFETLQALQGMIRQQSNTQMQFHVCLLGAEQLQANLDQLSLREFGNEIAQIITLKPFNLEETKQYLQHRLQVAGHSGPLPFDELMLQHIHQQSKGVPERINEITQRMLFANAGLPKNTSMSSVMLKIKNKLMGAVVVVFVLAGFLWSMDQKENKEAKRNNPVLTFNEVKPAMPETAPALPQAAEGSPELSTKQAVSQNAAPVNPNPTEDALLPSTPEQTLKPPLATAPTTADNASVVVPLATPADNTPAANKETPDQLDAQAQKAAAFFPVDEVAQPAEKHAESQAPTPVAKKHSHEKHKLSTHKKPLTSENSLKNTSHYYTLQILGLSNEKGIKHLAQHPSAQNKAHYYRTTLNGKPWYVLVYGRYASRSQAEQAKQNLPAIYKSYSPWVRASSSIPEDKKS